MDLGEDVNRLPTKPSAPRAPAPPTFPAPYLPPTPIAPPFPIPNSPNTSCFPNPPHILAPLTCSPNTNPAIVPFSLCNAIILSSTPPLTHILATSTSFVCPRRCTLSTACISTASFHQRSQQTTRLAHVKFNPTPPALILVNITGTCGSFRKVSSASWRAYMPMSPWYLM